MKTARPFSLLCLNSHQLIGGYYEDIQTDPEMQELGFFFRFFDLLN